MANNNTIIFSDPSKASTVEVASVLSAVIESIKKVSASLSKDIENNSNELMDARRQFSDDLNSIAADIKRLENLAKQVSVSGINELKKDITRLENAISEIEGFDSKPLEEKFNSILSDVSNDMLSKLKEKKSFDETNGEEVVDKINALPTDPQFQIGKEHIKGLIDDLKSLQESRTGGGGVTNMRIQQAFKYILKTEQPSGLIDGINTAYTVTQPIFAVLSFSMNGETIAQLPNYTISGKTITFSVALPSVYSGKDFEIKYI